LRNVTDDARRACADALPDAAAAGEHLRAALQRVALDRAAGAALYGLRARLQDVDLAGRAILAPLDIHRLAVVGLDRERLLRERDDVGVAEREALPVGTRHVDRLHALAAARLAVHHLDRLAA